MDRRHICSTSCILRHHFHKKLFLTWQSDEGLTLHPSSQQAVKHRRPALLLKPGEQRHQLGHRCLCAQVLHAQHLQWDAQKQRSSISLSGVGQGHVTADPQHFWTSSPCGTIDMIFISNIIILLASCHCYYITRVWRRCAAGKYNYSIKQSSLFSSDRLKQAQCMSQWLLTCRSWRF